MTTTTIERFDNGTRPVIYAQLLSKPDIPDGDRTQLEPTNMTARTRSPQGTVVSYTAADDEITLGGLYPTFIYPEALTAPGVHMVEIWTSDGSTNEDTTIIRFEIDVSPFG